MDYSSTTDLMQTLPNLPFDAQELSLTVHNGCTSCLSYRQGSTASQYAKSLNVGHTLWAC